MSGRQVKTVQVIFASFLNGTLRLLDAEIDSKDRKFPIGWISLRITGKSAALLGMQRFEQSGMVEVSMLGNPDSFYITKRLQQLTQEMGGALHWGQSNGLMRREDIQLAYGHSSVESWKKAQRFLGGDTFTNQFMRDAGLG